MPRPERCRHAQRCHPRDLVAAREARIDAAPLHCTLRAECEEDEAELALRRSRDEAQREAARAREAQGAAEAAMRAKAAFMATMSRELSAPLAAIMGLAQSLQAEEQAGSPRGQAAAAEIGSVAAHLRDLIGDVLELARIGAGETTLVEEDLNLDSIIADSLGAIDARPSQGRDAQLLARAPRGCSDGRRCAGSSTTC